MKSLTADDFPAFFRAVQGDDPFPWQAELARRVVSEGRWPALIDLPTGVGKTAAIDVAIFHLACEAEKGPRRTAPMRILFVIDRRFVVDEAFRRAKRIADALLQPGDDVVEAVRRRLSLLSGDAEHPLDAVRLRGGMPQERDWARSPAQPLVAVSTVDQVGSRLLFRGYGVSARMASVHAGLVGADALWLLDEVHLSQPLAETLESIVAGHGPTGEGALAREPRLAPFGVVSLSATPAVEATDAFRLTPADRADVRLRLRLAARKIAHVETVPGDLADAFSRHALDLLRDVTSPVATNRLRDQRKATTRLRAEAASPPRVHRLAVVVNRVDLARRVFEKLGDVLRATAVDAELILLTGRIRPLDRDAILVQIRPLFADPERSEPERPVILVATQTIEAGADLDIDALVTEVAPLDALRQRFGRLDRLGLRGESRATIVVSGSMEDRKRIEHIYGGAADATADWMRSLKGEIDLGVEGFESRLELIRRDPALSGRVQSPREHAPVLLRPYAELWAATSPVPPATPEPALFLHGPGRSPDVQVVWRADAEPADPDGTAARLEICPPSSLEAMPVPVWAVRDWLRQNGGGSFGDAPEREPEESPGPPTRTGRACMRRVGDAWTVASPESIRPGDTIVVPSTYGGSDAFGWSPGSVEKVRDLGAEAHYRQRLKGALRISRATLPNVVGVDARERWRRIADTILNDEERDAPDTCDQLLDTGVLADTSAALLRAIRAHRPRVEPFDAGDASSGVVIWSDARLDPGLLDPSAEDEETAGDEAVTDRLDSARIGVEVSLVDHIEHVETKARELAQRAGLPDSFVALVALAGRMHDLGKADPRFQADLRDRGALAVQDAELSALLFGEELLAKSAHGPWARPGPRAAPRNFRHEALSVALAERHPAVAGLATLERDLVLWLIGTHHGHGRPFFPPPADAAPALTTVEIDDVRLVARADEAPLRMDQGWFERAERLLEVYGPWELARMEALVRLADHAASAEEQAVSTWTASIAAERVESRS